MSKSINKDEAQFILDWLNNKAMSDLSDTTKINEKVKLQYRI